MLFPAAKYDVAISTGCSQLDSFLVDNAATAQACIKILKEQQLGIATFIALVSWFALFLEVSGGPTSNKNGRFHGS